MFKREALFPIKDWNCHFAALNDLPRTNNALEGWHKGFNQRFPKSNMLLSQFILRLKDEEESSWNLALRFNTLIYF